MSPIAIVFGILLGLLGPALYLLSDPEKQSLTAFIPSGFGVALILCGIVARNDKFRMHAMHVAALLGLIGFAMPAYMVTMAFVRALARDEGQQLNLDQVKLGGQSAMSALCLIFLILCVKSFIDVRIARKKKEAQMQPPVQ